MEQGLNKVIEILNRAKTEVAKVIIGQDEVVDKALVVIMTNNHALVEGVPGVAKTLLVRTLARVLGCDFSRIQFTPDLMPADITGTYVFNNETNRFSLVRGPIFTTFLLADEINRAPSKTQSALLQAMQERLVTIDRRTFSLSPNFTVFATQNPVEYEGTYPLPEAQKDRFMLKINMDHPSREEELDLAGRMLGNDSPESVLTSEKVKQVLTTEDLTELRKQLIEVTIKDELLRFVVDLVRTTREAKSVMVGAGPRATQALLLACRAWAVINGRDFVIPEDIIIMASPTLAHRLVLKAEYEIEGLSVAEVIQGILKDITIPK